LQCSLPYLFTGGDVATGPALVVDAIGGGRRAARSIHQYMTGEEIKGSPKSLRKRHIPESLFETVPGVVKIRAHPHAGVGVEERIDSMIEVDQVISEKDAKPTNPTAASTAAGSATIRTGPPLALTRQIIIPKYCEVCYSTLHGNYRH
jgi:hypothetical protein